MRRARCLLLVVASPLGVLAFLADPGDDETVTGYAKLGLSSYSGTNSDEFVAMKLDQLVA